jgi:hypothetical protein
VYELPRRIPEIQNLNEVVKIVKGFPDWASKNDRNAMGFDRREFIKIKLNHESKLIVVDNEGYALISGQGLGPLIAKKLRYRSGSH